MAGGARVIPFRGPWSGTDRSGLCEHQCVKAIVIEERIAYADLGECGTSEVLTMARVAPIVDPPVDDSLPIERGIIAVDVFGDRSRHKAAVPDARLGC